MIASAWPPRRGDLVRISDLPVGAWFKAPDDVFYRVMRLNGCTPDVERFGDTTDTVVPYNQHGLVTFDEFGDAALCALHNVACCLVCAAQRRQGDVNRTTDALRRFDEKTVMDYIAALPPNERHLTVTFWEPLVRQGTISVAIGDSFEARNEGGLLASLAAAVRALPGKK